jgi:hypothetical protein
LPFAPTAQKPPYTIPNLGVVASEFECIDCSRARHGQRASACRTPPISDVRWRPVSQADVPSTGGSLRWPLLWGRLTPSSVARLRRRFDVATLPTQERKPARLFKSKYPDQPRPLATESQEPFRRLYGPRARTLLNRPNVHISHGSNRRAQERERAAARAVEKAKSAEGVRKAISETQKIVAIWKRGKATDGLCGSIRRSAGDAQIGLPQPHTVHPVQSLDRRVLDAGLGACA